MKARHAMVPFVMPYRSPLIAPVRARKRLTVSREMWDRINRDAVAALADIFPNGSAADNLLAGMEVTVSAHLPFWSDRYRLESLDRFAEYSAADAVWAVPAGLARWVGGHVHAVLMYESLRVSSPLQIRLPKTTLLDGL